MRIRLTYNYITANGNDVSIDIEKDNRDNLLGFIQELAQLVGAIGSEQCLSVGDNKTLTGEEWDNLLGRGEESDD